MADRSRRFLGGFPRVGTRVIIARLSANSYSSGTGVYMGLCHGARV